MAEQVLFAGITTDIYSVYIEKDQKYVCTILRHSHTWEKTGTSLDIVCHSVVSSSRSHYIPKFKVNVNCILPVLCKLFDHKFPSTSSIPSQNLHSNRIVSWESCPICMHGHNSNPCINSRVLLEFYIAMLLVKGGHMWVPLSNFAWHSTSAQFVDCTQVS